MPTVSQVSTIDTPLAFIGTPNCSTVGPSFGSCSIAPVMNRCADGRRSRTTCGRGSCSRPRPLGLAGSFQPVRSARRQKLDALGGDALEQAVGRRLLMRPTPGRGRRRVGVHRQRQRGRRAIVRQRAQHRGGLGARQSGPAEFGRNRQREEFALPQQLEIGGGEFVRLVAAAPFLGELGPISSSVARQSKAGVSTVRKARGQSWDHLLVLICSTPRGDRSLRPPKSDHKAGGLFS